MEKSKTTIVSFGEALFDHFEDDFIPVRLPANPLPQRCY